MNDSFNRELEVFAAALKRTGTERIQYLSEVCAANPDLYQRILALLKAHEEAGAFLQDSPTEVRTVSNRPLDGEQPGIAQSLEGPGSCIDRYKLLQQIGEGGMGVVYMAEQEEPVRRRVALKIIKLGMDSQQVVARFEAERQALALMDHPNIARVFDGGTTQTGRPYFVMELVQGVPITDFCNKSKLSTKERLNLFVRVCQAIQSAHQKGVIHRDIKPSNVLVTLHDGVPVPKVIDFGIAKATHQKLTEKTLFTNFATMIGTPAYMSPEQAEMSGLDVDTRTDIYALGVLLYALLTGTTPFPEKRLRSLGYGEMQRVIREEEPQRPSTRLGTLTSEESTTFAKNCGVELIRLQNLLKGDLDWIVMKCLEKDRARRYDTANGLAADLERHLSNEPVIARPPSAGYRFGKLIRRNRTLVVASGAVALVVVLAVAFSIAALLSERKAMIDAADSARRREEALRMAQGETVRADAVARFVDDFFDGVIPELYASGNRRSIQRVLHVAGQLSEPLTNAPFVAANLEFAVAKAYLQLLSDYSKAAVHFDAARMQAEKSGAPGLQLAKDANVFGLAARLWPLETNALTQLRALGREALGSNPPDKQMAAVVLCALADFESLNAPTEADRLARESVALAKAVGSTRNPPYNLECGLALLTQLAIRRGSVGDAETAADELFERLLSRSNSGRGSGHAEFSFFMRQLIDVSDHSLLPEGSIRKALAKLRPEDHELRRLLTGILGRVVARQGSWQDARSLLLARPEGGASGVIHFWSDAFKLSSLLRDSEMERTLVLSGLTEFGAAADEGTTIHLLWNLLLLPLDRETVSAISGLVAVIDAPSPNLEVFKWFPLALYRYRTGDLTGAMGALDRFVDSGPKLLGPSFDLLRPSVGFVTACIEMKRGNRSTAKLAYEDALKQQPKSLESAGVIYTGAFWPFAAEGEILRREAASLIEGTAQKNQ